MSILVFAESTDGVFKKSTFEAVCYARHIANATGSPVIAAALGISDPAVLETLSHYGADQVLSISGTSFEHFDAQMQTAAIASAAQSVGATTLVISNTYSGKAIAPRLAVLMNAALATNVVDLPNLDHGFSVKRGVFSGKAFAHVSTDAAVKVIALTPNSLELSRNERSASYTNFSFQPSSASKVQVTGINKVSGKIPLTEAEVVVSGGRGMKGPEHWGMIEELATALGAATACSKPVSDMGWRPHSEHVGQTGITIKPNLYIAVGISGAIQHLAGVSSSKVIVAINKDPEAPFFKAADYGIVGDAFDVLPRLLDAVRSGAQQA
jgi:electron transfer flavoprotein alpha subunit